MRKKANKQHCQVKIIHIIGTTNIRIIVIIYSKLKPIVIMADTERLQFMVLLISTIWWWRK